MADKHIRIEDTGTPRPDLSVDQLWELVHHWRSAWLEAANESINMYSLLERLAAAWREDGNGVLTIDAGSFMGALGEARAYLALHPRRKAPESEG